ncbi:Deacetylase [Pseudomonas chlororaphis subsp. piscium]|nr:Deacetylase [Pseudomonas chlororaphis subsp. piscium]AZC57549.1 Deacetylase [Pseudomonas chlororaphis subsp. piscium]QTT88756.1 class II histone deacetylase [Pseudomonas chlororaphis]
MGTGFVWHELFMWHSTGCHAGIYKPGLTIQPGTPFEEAETKRRFKNLLDVSGITDDLFHIRPRALRRDELEMVHSAAYLDELEAMSKAGGGAFSANTPFGAGSYDIAALSAGGVIEAVDAVMRGDVKNAYALVRPPGHHAVADAAMGFCLFANGSLAAKHAIEKHGLERVAIVDWDVHHGNGAQDIFWESSKVLTISIHQKGNYPSDSGCAEERGLGAGAGYNLNIPMLPGSGHGAYLGAMDTLIVPALREFDPQLIIVSCGFDAGAYDPLGRMLLHSDSFRDLTQRVMEAADISCKGKLVMCHEGGYEQNTVPYMGLAVIETLSGIKTGISDPNLDDMKGLFGQETQSYQREHLMEIRKLLQCPAETARRS